MSEKTHDREEAEKQKNQPASTSIPSDDKPIQTQESPQGKQGKKDKKQAKSEGKKESVKPAKKHGENFQYIVRIANTDIDGEKNIIMGLTQIKGVGRHIASFIANASGIALNTLIGDLTEEQIQKIKDLLENLSESAPSWMLNHRKDLDTGEDLHLISTDVQTKLRDDINLMKMIRCYRGVRHELNLKVRGQRTSSNGRKGLALGVQRRKEGPAAASSTGGK